MRLKHYSIRTERCYCDWIVRFIRCHSAKASGNSTGGTPAGPTGTMPVLRWRHPREMAEAEVTAFLTHLARDGNAAASTQNQALSALLFLYQQVLKEEIGWLEGVELARKPKRLPIVLTRDEVQQVSSNLQSTPRLMAVSSTAVGCA